jgi:methylthioribose-1-phosphate isomerase
MIPTLRWTGGIDGRLAIIDQTLLPLSEVEIELADVDAVWEAIRSLRIRGAPAIGLAAGYGVVLGVRDAADGDDAKLTARLRKVVEYLASSRPTAVNLAWALARQVRVAKRLSGRPPREIVEGLLAEAHAMIAEDQAMCRAIGRHGAALLSDGDGVLTHCNAGALVTSGCGTALGVIFEARAAGKRLHVYVDETRPLLQGARLTAWELMQAEIPATLICDSMAATVMREGRVQAVIVGADRIAANGDVANKIGTYQVALSAAAHDIPFYVAAPSSTFDLSIASGTEIPIEERQPEEITHGFGRQTAPAGIDVYNPAFDVTPARLIRAIVCEKGVIEPVTAERIAETLGSPT